MRRAARGRVPAVAAHTPACRRRRRRRRCCLHLASSPLHQPASLQRCWSMSVNVDCRTASASGLKRSSLPAAAGAGVAPFPAHAQGLLGLLGGGASGSKPLTNTTGPQCANAPATIRTALAAVPAPAADQLCDALLDSPIDTCNLGAMVEWGLTGTAVAPPKCNGALKQAGGGAE